MKYCVYLLKSLKRGNYYIGQTNNFERRFLDHNRGKDHSSKIGKPWIPIAKKEFSTRSEAMATEKMLKSFKKRSRLEEYIAGWSSGSSRGS